MLGVLGGMGPMATVDFMRKMVENTPAGRDQDHLQIIVCSDAGIPDRTEAILGIGPDPLPAMLEALHRLEAAGASCVAVPCNTAHYWYDSLSALSRLPILHIVEAVAAELGRRGISGGRIGLLATTGTIQAGIYQQRLAHRGFTCVAPDAQDEVMSGIRLVKVGKIKEARMVLERQAERLLASGCRAVVLACTEVPVALAQASIDLQPNLIDATDALAKACIQHFRPGTGTTNRSAA